MSASSRTGQDVIHSFFVPSLGVQRYTIPGRALETWMRADRPGIFYGQCNQICGVNHWFMPIAVRAVSRRPSSTSLGGRGADALRPGPAAGRAGPRAPADRRTVQIAEARR
jgi:cytochrome c oxidase subunit 2